MSRRLNMFVKIIMFSVLSSAFAATLQADTSSGSLCDINTGEGCTIEPDDCKEVCGCDKTFKYDAERGGCVVNLEYLRQLNQAITYNSEDNDDMALEDRITTRLRERVERVFRGILISAVFFIVCASVCIVTVCLFCCHIRHSDRKLKKEVKALAEKFKVDIKNRATSTKKENRDQKEESCNVIVQDADIMCV